MGALDFVGNRSSSGGIIGAMIRLVLRFFQFVLAITVAGLARHAGMAPRTFARHFTAATGTTPLHWLHDQRIAAARRLLERTDLPMPEAARRAARRTSTVFSARATGVAPIRIAA